MYTSCKLTHKEDQIIQRARQQSFSNRTLPSNLNADQLAAQGFYFSKLAKPCVSIQHISLLSIVALVTFSPFVVSTSMSDQFYL